MAQKSGDTKRSAKHYMVSAGYGEDYSLERTRMLLIQGNITKEEFQHALRTHKDATDKSRSDQRDAATANQKFMDFLDQSSCNLIA